VEPTLTTLSLYEPMETQFCPECGALMTEEDRLHDNETLFIWFRCSKSDCQAKWLSWKEGPGNPEMTA
jgi:hypothetical protein